MNFQLNTHCPSCFKPSQSAVCPHCHFDRDKYLREYACNHHLPLFTRLEKGYVIGRVLGEGGFAIVYAALREADGLVFAVKEYCPKLLASRSLDRCTVQPISNETERFNIWQKRFKEEAEHLRRCQDYPAIAGVVKRADLLEQNNTVYLVMERLQGKSLRDYLTEPKSAQWILGWLKPLLATFEQLHNRQIFHRDVSPNNVFLTAENQPVLMDFGLAREGIRDSALKSSTVGAGTEGFIAPEQTMAAASSRVDARTDLYSLGGLVYMALHGELPPGAGQRAQGAQLRRCQNADSVMAQLEAMALHCLALDRDKRPENVGAINRQYALLWRVPASEKTIVPDVQLKNNNYEVSQNEKTHLDVKIKTQSKISVKKLLTIIIFIVAVDYYGYPFLENSISIFYRYWGNNLSDNGDKEGAIKKYQKAIQLNPKDADSYYNWGRILHDSTKDKGNEDEAIEKYKKAIELNPKHSDAYRKLGLVLYAKNNADEATEKFKKAIELNPNDEDSYNDWGILLGRRGDYDNAIEKFKKAIELNPQFFGAYFNFGVALSYKGDCQNAKIKFYKAIELHFEKDLVEKSKKLLANCQPTQLPTDR